MRAKVRHVRISLGCLHRFQPMGCQRLCWGGEDKSLAVPWGSHVCCQRTGSPGKEETALGDLSGPPGASGFSGVVVGGRVFRSKCLLPLSTEGPPLSNTTFPHVLPFITLLECDSAPAEGPEPWGSTEHGVEVVLAHLEAARTVAHHGGLYHTNAEVKLQGE